MKRIYWDSCAFIHRLQGTPEYLQALDQQITRAKNDECSIITSAVSLAEVCKLPELGMLKIEESDKILAFFESEYIEMWQADRLVCKEAHHLMRHHVLKPMDAIHVATALLAKVDLVVTTDTKKYRREGLIQLDGKIGNPPLRIGLPDLGTFLPLFGTATQGKASESTSDDDSSDA